MAMEFGPPLLSSTSPFVHMSPTGQDKEARVRLDSSSPDGRSLPGRPCTPRAPHTASITEQVHTLQVSKQSLGQEVA